MRWLASRFALLHVRAIFSCFVAMLTYGVIRSACPCPPIDTERAFVACDLLAGSVDADQVRVQDAACFQGPVQLCSGASGLPDPVIEGLWRIIDPQGQPTIGPGESVFRPLGRTRSVDCTGVIFTIDFHQQTADPADAFTLLKTIQAGDTLQFTRIDPGSCEVVQVANACAEADVVECGPMFTVSVFDAPGLFPLYAFPPFDDYVSLLNFGPKSPDSIQLSQQQECTNCPLPGCPDLLCWPSQVCSGLTAGFIPPECTGLTGANERILVNADHLGGVALVAVPKTTLGGCSVADALCSTRIGDRLRIYALGIANETPLNTPPAQLGWATAISEVFGGPTAQVVANAIAINTSGRVVLAGEFRSSLTAMDRSFAASQLMPNMDGSVDLDWATNVFEPFGSSERDTANGVAIDASGNIILAGTHTPLGTTVSRFAALQLIPNLSGGVDLGWATAPIEPFGSSSSDMANGVAIDFGGSIVLAGSNAPLNGAASSRFAALQLIPNLSGGVDLGWATAPQGVFGGTAAESARARAIAIDTNGAVILGGGRAPLVDPRGRFAALQLIPNMLGGVNLGWATAVPEPFAPDEPGNLAGDEAFALAIDCNNNAILAGGHRDTGLVKHVAALQLLQNGTSVSLGWATALDEPFGPIDSLIGDEARGVAVDKNNNIIVSATHEPAGLTRTRMAAVQLIPGVAGGIDVGWSTDLFGVFGANTSDSNGGLAIDSENGAVLAGDSVVVSPLVFQMSAAQLRQPTIPAYGDYEITGISEVEDFILFEVVLIDTESSIICPGQELCVKNFGFCCA